MFKQKPRRSRELTKAPPSKRQTGRRLRRRAVYTMITMAILVVIGISVFNALSVQMEYDAVLAEQKALLMQKQLLSNELTQVDSPEYVEQQARTHLRMIMPGERLYILTEAGSE